MEAVVSNMPCSSSAPVRTYPAAVSNPTNSSDTQEKIETLSDYRSPTSDIPPIDLMLQQTIDVGQLEEDASQEAVVAATQDFESVQVRKTWLIGSCSRGIDFISFLMKVEPKVRTVYSQVDFGSRRITFDSISDSDLNYATGLDRERFLIIFRMLERFCPISDSLLLITLFKVRHNWDYLMIQFQFQIRRQSIAAVFNEVIHKLYVLFKQIDIWNISHYDAKSYRTILDCTDMYVFGSGTGP